MALKLADKQAIVADVAKIATTAQSAIVASYRGMTVTEMTALRAKAREAGVYLRVVRNTLARRAIANTAFQCAENILLGPVLLAFSQNEPGAAARVISDFMKTNKKLEIKGIALGGKLLNADQLDKVALLPTYEQALGQLLSVMKAPITKLVRTLAEPHAKLVRTFAAVRDSKQTILAP